MKILYVEDDPSAREYIEKGLLEQGFEVDVAPDGETGVERALEGAYDLLILDVMLPKQDGFGVLKALRAKGLETPALFLSARNDVTDRVRGLDAGADDYLSKPFAFAELLARIRAIARRRHGESPDGRLTAGDVVLDRRRHEVKRGGETIHVTPKEFTLLEYLMSHAGEVVSRSMITQKVWGHSFDSYSNLIDVHINHLRKKIEQEGRPRLIRTVKGVGYLLDEPDPADDGSD